MTEFTDKILVWLPSPMGDAMLATPALRAIRRHFDSAKITFLANRVVREVLSPNPFNNDWIDQTTDNPLALAQTLRSHHFTKAVLLKNSFASALTVFLAAIPSRIGYTRQARSMLLTETLHPPCLSNGKFKPISMIDYYFAIASWLGADTSDRTLQLQIEPGVIDGLRAKLPQVFDAPGPVVVLVPGGAFGLSKCWPADPFAQTADWLIENCSATVVVSVSPEPLETQIAADICSCAKHSLVNLAQNPLTLAELKALFSIAELVITNDTGPRHIAIAFKRKVITLFGPNDPAWTETDHGKEIQIVGNVPCAPCARPACAKTPHLCMNSITTQMVCDAAADLLSNRRTSPFIFAQPRFIETSKSFFVNADYKETLTNMGLDSVDSVFHFNKGENLTKNNLAPYRNRLRLQITPAPATLFLKRYDRPPIRLQIVNWLSQRHRRSLSSCELEPTLYLSAASINVPAVVAFGWQWGTVFERRSFIITRAIPHAESLERKLPLYVTDPQTPHDRSLCKDFFTRLAAFIRKFHNTGYRHRDLYLSHIFSDDAAEFHLIDLARAFQPRVFAERFRTKDIAQLHYSAPAQYFSNTDRLRFYLAYIGHTRLTKDDKRFIRKVITKAHRMAQHDLKHDRAVPFLRPRTRNLRCHA